jgi:hypothetical protein
MAKIVLIVLLSIYSNSDEFETNCLNCHQDMQLYRFFQKYVYKYSSQKRVTDAIYKYIKNPQAKDSIMPFGFIRRFGVKPKLDIDDEVLKKAIDIYYKKFDFKNRIK